MNIDDLKLEVARLSGEEQAQLIGYLVQLRYARDPAYRNETTQRLNDQDKSHWLTPEEFERSLDQQ